MAIRMKTTEQNKAIWGLASKLGMSKDDLEEMAEDVSGGKRSRISKITFDDANAMIARMGGDPFPKNRRDLNRQKRKAGVKTMETKKHWNAIRDAWTSIDNPRRTEKGLSNLCMRMLGKRKPATTEEGNKIFEAIKAMNSRERKRRAA